ncbi:MAG: bile acid:sodium symporter [Desulfarculaceae bacterium]|nr:bile acid:sodium symporter [Desulfarculaceae bacterium]
MRETLGKLKPLLLIAVVGFILSPIWAYFINSTLLRDSQAFAIVGFTLFAVAPGNLLAPAFTAIRKGDASLPLLFYTVSYLFALGFVPLWSQLLLGKIVPIPISIIMRSFFLVIGAPLLLAFIIRRFFLRSATPQRAQKINSIIKVVGSLSFASIFFSIFAERGGLLFSQPDLMVKIIPAASLLMLACLLSGLGLSKIFGLSREATEGVMIAGATKNSFLGMAIAASAFSNKEAIVVALCGPLTQLPFMILYVTIMGIMIKRN